MTSVRIIQCMAGNGFVWDPGQIVELEEREAARLIEAGYAAALEPECAAITTPESKMLPTARKRKSAHA